MVKKKEIMNSMLENGFPIGTKEKKKELLNKEQHKYVTVTCKT